MTVAVLYAAKSTADSHDSIPGQLQTCREHADRRGWPVDSEFSDEAKTAFRGSRGPDLVRARERCAELAVGDDDVVLLVAVSDRLARGDGSEKAAHLVEYALEAKKRGYRVESVAEGELGLMIASMLGDRANADSAAKSFHVQQGKRRAAVLGARAGGQRPFGYEQRRDHEARRTWLVPIGGEFAAIRRMRDSFVAGATYTQIARELNSDGVPTTKGAKWSDARVRQILTNDLYRGFVKHHDERFEGKHETPCSADEWAEFDRVAAARRRKPSKGVGRPVKGSHLLVGGKLQCGECGSSIVPRTTTNQQGRLYEMYRCIGAMNGSKDCSRKRGIRRERIDLAILDFFKRTAYDLEGTRRRFAVRREGLVDETRQRLADVEKRLAKQDLKIASLKRLFEEREDVSDAEWRRYFETVEAHEAGRDATAEQVERFRGRLRDLIEQHEAADSSLDRFVDAMSSLSLAMIGIGDQAEHLDALRATIDGLYERFVVHYIDDLPDEESLERLSGTRVVSRGDGRSFVLPVESLSEVLQGRRELPLLVIEPVPLEGVELPVVVNFETGDQEASETTRLSRQRLSDFLAEPILVGSLD